MVPRQAPAEARAGDGRAAGVGTRPSTSTNTSSVSIATPAGRRWTLRKRGRSGSALRADRASYPSHCAWFGSVKLSSLLWKPLMNLWAKGNGGGLEKSVEREGLRFDRTRHWHMVYTMVCNFSFFLHSHSSSLSQRSPVPLGPFTA